MIEPEEKDDKPSQDETSKTSVQTDNSSSQATIDASAPSEQTIDDPTPPMLEKNSDAPASPQTSPLENIMPAPRIEPVKDATASIHEWRKSTQKIDKSKEARGKKAPSAAAPKRKRKKREGMLSAASGFLSFILVALVAGAFGVIAVRHKSKEPGPLAADTTLYFPPRSDTPEMIAQLQREGVIDSPLMMNIAMLLEGARTKLKQGEYLFKAKASLHDVIDELVAGRQIMHSLTIPEGLTTEQILQRMRESDMLAGDVVEPPKEGSLLPETYKFPRAFPRARLVTKMQDDARKLLEQVWAKRNKDLPLRSPYELLTLASIVEKETGKNEERPRVAAVFVNRLRKHMRLQSDPTIIYGVVGGKGTLGRGITRAEIDKWTPYNTYAIDGLPPGPIANPGRAALEATANPAETQDLYFVADGTGGHVFAETLEQHARNVQQWRRIEQEQKQKTDEIIDHALPDAAPPAMPKNDKRTQAPIGRLVHLNAEQEDYPIGRDVSPDSGPTHRLGKYSLASATFFLGGYADPTEPAARELSIVRRHRAYFTEELAQRHDRDAFDPSLLTAQTAPPQDHEEDLVLGPDMMARESADGLALPEEPDMSASSQHAPTVTAMAMPQQNPDRPRAFDASEGTALDPLRDRSWDLTSAKTVPSNTTLR